MLILPSYCLLFLIQYVVCILRYDDFNFFTAIPTSMQELEFIENLTTHFQVIMWKESKSLEMPIDFILKPKDLDEFILAIQRSNITIIRASESIQKMFNYQKVRPYNPEQKKYFNWNSFYKLDDIYAWMRDLSKKHPNIINVQSIGKTHEHRDILYLSIKTRTKSGKKIQNRPKVVFEGGIIGREWLSIVFVTYLINHIHLNATLKSMTMAKQYEWYFIPVLNPDGYEYSHTTDRMWVKNRNPYGPVDINRNFGAKFGLFDCARARDSDKFCGEFQFSEPESLALKKFLTRLKVDLTYYISFRSYGPEIYIPYAYYEDHHDNYAAVYDLALKAAYEIKDSRDTEKQYSIGTHYELKGFLQSGASTCWVKRNFKTPFVVTFNLASIGTYGHALPPELIMSMCEETVQGLQMIFDTKERTKLVSVEKTEEEESSANVYRASNYLIIILHAILITTF